MKYNLIVLHFQPIENYPPLLNFANCLTSYAEEVKVKIISTIGSFPIKQIDNISQSRIGISSRTKLGVWINYIMYNIISIVLLLRYRPKKVLYYETISSFPAVLYKKFLNKNAKIFIHYHEYVSPKEYSSGTAIVRKFHMYEQTLYESATWISHTNEVRLNKFLKDNGLNFHKCKYKYLPNYPLKQWAQNNKKWSDGMVLKLIFVGYSVEKDSSYIISLFNWLLSSNVDIELDIYCIKRESIPKNIIGDHGKLKVRDYEAISYNQLSEVIQHYHIGLILYRATTPNYIHNAPNKLFEYLACGLDVWYPEEMKGIHKYDSDKRPAVKRLTFNNLPSIEDMLPLSKEKREIDYFAENVYQILIDKIVK